MREVAFLASFFFGMVGWVVEDGCRCSNENFDVLFGVENHNGIMIWNVALDVFKVLKFLSAYNHS